jgi:hypothetical protein
MPRPPVDRVSRLVRLRRPVDDRLRSTARRSGRSLNEEIELAVSAWCDGDALRAENAPEPEPAPTVVQVLPGPEVDPGPCSHPNRRYLGYATRCADCKAILR